MTVAMTFCRHVSSSLSTFRRLCQSLLKMSMHTRSSHLGSLKKQQQQQQQGNGIAGVGVHFSVFGKVIEVDAAHLKQTG